MSNRTTLYLLMILAAAAVGMQLWSNSSLKTWDESLAIHKARYKTIWETCDDLTMRREDAPKGTADNSFRMHFQRQAHKAHMGDINVSVNPLAAKQNYADTRFEIDFHKGDEGFQRASLRTFLFRAEQLYPRIRTTAFNIRPIGGTGRSRGIDPGVERDDIWEITKMEFRQRTPVAKAN